MTQILYFILFLLISLKAIASMPKNEVTKDLAKNIPIDYHLANINDSKHLALGQVPRDKNIYIYQKTAAIEPLQIYEGKLRGKGFQEPFFNAIILALKKEKIPIYVDYFTGSKTRFYRNTPGYSFCGTGNRPFHQYKKNIIDLKKNGYKDINKKFTLLSKIYFTSSPIKAIGLAKNKRNLFNKHLWKNSQVYNILSILEDPQLYTAQIINSASITFPFIYDKNQSVLKKYKTRVYEFVASNSFQIPLMLQGNRMNYADISISAEDFYLKKMNIPEEKVKMVYASGTHPDLITPDDLFVGLIICGGYNLDQLKKMMNIINATIINLRTNYSFWEKVLQQYSMDMEIPYQSPLDFYFVKESFKLKKQIDRGDFDINYL